MGHRQKLAAAAFALLIVLSGLRVFRTSKHSGPFAWEIPNFSVETLAGSRDGNAELSETTETKDDFDSIWDVIRDARTEPEQAAASEVVNKIKLGNLYLKQHPTIPLVPLKKTLLVSTSGRAGSSFLGELIASFPGTHYIFEPLFVLQNDPFMEINQTVSIASAQIVKQWLQCSRGNSNSYFKEYMESVFYRKLSNPSSTFFQNKTEVCSRDIDFAEKLCTVHRVRLVKTIRMWLQDVEVLLRDEAFTDTRVVLLLRDPRAILASWQSIGWCNDTAPCLAQTKGVFHKMQNDIESYTRLSSLYPGQFYLIRHEDLSLNVSKEAERLFKFLQLPFTAETRAFIDKHTSQDTTGVFETTRNSSQVPYRWLKALDKELITSVEEEYKDFMEKAGYRPLKDRSTFSYEPLDIEKLVITS